MSASTKNAPTMFNWRSTLTEISARVENVLSEYELMEEQESEPHTKATYGELAKADNARELMFTRVALNDIASEIGHLLTELGEKAIRA